MKALVPRCVCAAVCFLAFSYAGRADSSYPVAINLYSCPINTVGICTQPGTLSVNGVVYTIATTVNFPAGSTLTLVATPGSSYVFGGWGSLAGVSGQTATATVTVNGPLTIAPVFTPASTASIGILTQPAGLQVIVDGATLSSATLNWAWFTTHTLAVKSPQKDPNGNWWIFVGWSDGGAATHTVSMRAGMVTDQYIARFVPGMPVDIISHPPGMHVTIDNTTDCVQCTVIWGAAETHTLSVPVQQTDDKGLTYRFANWSDGNSRPAKIVTPFDLQDRMSIAALFDRLGLLSLDSSPDSIRLQVDDGDCYTPCLLQKPLGKAVSVKAPESYIPGFGTRADFLNWSGSSGSKITLTPTPEMQTVKAWFKSMRQMVATAVPEEGAKVILDPPSPDGFYDANSKVNITLVPQPGYRLDHWDGDLTGTDPGGWLTMGSPRNVIARMHAIPYLPPRSVRNAATEIHGDTVTACSIVTISGIHLATASESVGTGTPRQVLAGIGVRMGDSYLPLYAVTPTEISAQLPCNLPDGSNTLTVHAGYEPEASTDFTVTRNAPGLFSRNIAGKSYAMATHADGRAVTPDNPVTDGETISVFGTGFGPTTTPAPQGVTIHPTPEFCLADPLEAFLGTTSLTTSYAGAGGSQPGINTVQVKIDINGSSTFKVRINGQESNEVILPIAE
jgi:uncharacterized protein (TIGR03437 family)